MFTAGPLFGDQHPFRIGLASALSKHLRQLLIGLWAERFGLLFLDPEKPSFYLCSVRFVRFTKDGGVDKPI